VRANVAGARIAARFYTTMAEAIVESCVRLRWQLRVETVALSGGCFQSALLSERTKRKLELHGFEVLVHGLVPPNDGGIALGQAAVAAYRAMRAEEGGSSHVSRHSG
jgi:hydrogenase maturation protein HypF